MEIQNKYYFIKNKIKVKYMAFDEIKGEERLYVHQPDYKPKSFQEYSFQELGNIVGFFVKRAGHRANEEKLRKDLYDAKNYLAMMEIKLKAKTEELGIVFEEL